MAVTAPQSRKSGRNLPALILLAVLTLVLSFPGIRWGLPLADQPDHTSSEVPDEVGGIHALVHIWRNVHHTEFGSLQYPLFHYGVIDAFYAPYLLFELVRGGLTHPRPGYPFGFTNPQSAVQRLWLISRGISILMGIGTVLVASEIGSELWDPATGILSAIIVLLIYPFTFYAKMSNVDVPALFWTSLVVLLFVRMLKDGLSPGRARWMGFFAALAVATKDQSYASMAVLGASVLVLHLRRSSTGGSVAKADGWRPLLQGLLVFVGVYLIISGFLLWPSRFLAHVSYIRYGGAGGDYYFTFAPTAMGYLGLLRQCANYFVDALGWPFLIVGLAGMVTCLRSERRKLTLLLLIPGLLFLVFVPVRYVALRFILPWALVSSFFVARGGLVLWRSPRLAFRVAAALLVLAGSALQLAKSADFTALMYRDPRVSAASWFAQNARRGDQVEYFGPRRKAKYAPRLPKGVTYLLSSVGSQPGSGRLQGDFVLLMGAGDLIVFTECPRWIHDGLEEDSLAYSRVAEFHTQTLFPMEEYFAFLNPAIQVFSRGDRTPALPRATRTGGVP